MRSAIKPEIVEYIRDRRQEKVDDATIKREIIRKYEEVSGDDVADSYLTFEKLSIAPGVEQYTLTIQQLQGGNYIVRAYGSDGSMPLRRTFSWTQIKSEFSIIMTPLDLAVLEERIETNKGHGIRVLNSSSDVYPDIVRTLQLK
jgi:hypothetical protein